MSLISIFIVLSAVILSHELGHFIVTKLLSIRVSCLSFGFGPKLLKMPFRGTQYALSLIPLGGYVQFEPGPSSETFSKDSPYFTHRPPLHKVLVSLAGPLANIVLTVIIMCCVYMVGTKQPVYMTAPPAVGWVSPESEAFLAGVRPGDLIRSVDGTPVSTWRDLIRSFPVYPASITVIIEKENSKKEVLLRHISRFNHGLSPHEDIIIQGVQKDSPASRAGLQLGDRISAIDDVPLTAWVQFLYTVARSEEALSLTIVRGGRIMPVPITPMENRKLKRRLVGISFFSSQILEKYSFTDAVAAGFFETYSMIIDSFAAFAGIIQGAIPMKNLGGLIGIAQASQEAARVGLGPLLSFMAFLSVQICIFNLLPILPILDGGQIVIFVFEYLRQRPLGDTARRRVDKLGWAVFLCLLGFVSYNDILKYLFGS